MDDDDQLAEDLEGLDITACKETIEQLLAERERRLEYTERLQEKLKALNNELAARTEELDRRNKELQEEQRRNKRKIEQHWELREAAAGSGALVQIEDAEHLKLQREQVRGIMESQLQALLQQRASSVALGMPLVEKPTAEVRKEAMRIDTVLITYLRANTDEKYYLSYRVGENVKAAQLRRDACLYWGLSEVEYILWTHTEGSKVHDELLIQNCFKPHEEARLVLRRKTPQEVRVMERERDAIRPLIGRLRKGRGAKKAAAVNGAEGAEVKQVGDQPVGILEEMSVVPGLREFMTRRDQNVVNHLDRIKLRNICLYGFLIGATLVSLGAMLPPDYGYVCRHGLYTAMTQQTSHSVAFQHIRSEQAAWDWLRHTVGDQLMNSSSQVRQTNHMPGWLHIRMQHVKPASHDQCPETVPSNVVCFAQDYNADTAGTEVLESLQEAWVLRNEKYVNQSLEAELDNETNARAVLVVAPGELGEYSAVNYTTTSYPSTTSIYAPSDYPFRGTAVPWGYRSADADSGSQGDRVGVDSGLYQRYDASGYEIDYDLQYSNLQTMREVYRSDMDLMKKNNWLDSRTRAVHVSFTTYNGNYDLWVDSHFLIEMPGSGIIETSSHVMVFKPVIADYGLGHFQLIVDSCRLVVVLYILLFQIYWEWSYEKRVKNSSLPYILGPQGLADLALVGCFLAIYGLRFLTFGLLAKDTVTFSRSLSSEYTSAGDEAQLYKYHMILEGVVLSLAIFRFFSFLRINRQVFVIWRTIVETLYCYRWLLLCLPPVFPGLVVLAHTIWRPFLPMYRTFWSSFGSILMLLIGEHDLHHSATDTERPGTLVFMLLFYFSTVLIFINSFISVLVQTHQRVRVTCGYVSRLYNWEEYNYAQWCLWKPVQTVYTWLRGSRMRIPFDEDHADHQK
mmetsp:Transcript_27169/g.68982  ORF Transcript_27169/g.68982 Transcript_27169/m.68982 type:complete len:906 (+) Transcript_27169:66-2783(+)